MVCFGIDNKTANEKLNNHEPLKKAFLTYAQLMQQLDDNRLLR
jgi:acid stress-induced BolA-like protein IbaG/YrbA